MNNIDANKANPQHNSSKNYKTIWKILIAVIITSLSVGTGFYIWHMCVLNDIEKEVSKTMGDIHSKISELQTENTELIYQLKSEIAQLRQKEELEKGLRERLLSIYGYDSHEDREKIDFFLSISESQSLFEKLRIVADNLSRFRFGNNPINVLRIEDRNYGKIAIVDLREPGEPKAHSWSRGYFQGSSGGRATTTILVKTFLQDDYAGKWIDGVEFYYEGEPISDEWDHIFLSGIKYRRR